MRDASQAQEDTTEMADEDLVLRAGNNCEFCGAAGGLDAVDVPPLGEVLL